MGLVRSLWKWIIGQADLPSVRPPPRAASVGSKNAPVDSIDPAAANQAGVPLAGGSADRREHPPLSDSVSARQERAAERLLEDESLRGDVTSEQLQPLLDWALEVSVRIIACTGAMTDAEAQAATDAGLARLRLVVQAAARAIVAMLDAGPEARNAELRELSEIVGPPLVPPEAVVSSRMTLTAAFDRLAADRSLAGAELAQALAAALGRAVRNDVEEGNGRHAAE